MIHPVIGFEVYARALQIGFGDGAQDRGLVRPADEDLADEFLRTDRLARRQAMVARHQHHQRLLRHHPVFQIELRFDAEKSHVEAATDERIGEVGRIVAGDLDLDAVQLVAQNMHCLRKPGHFVPGLETDGERRPGRLRRPPGRFTGCIGLRQRQPRMIEEGATRRGQRDTARTAGQKLGSDLGLEIADLPAQRGL